MIINFKPRVVLAAAFWCSVIASLSAQQLSDVRDLLGPRFGPSGTATKPPLFSCPMAPARANFSAIGTRWPWTPAVWTTPHWLQATRPAFLANNSGPARAARAVAIMHIAMFDAVNAIDHKYPGFHEYRPG